MLVQFHLGYSGIRSAADKRRITENREQQQACDSSRGQALTFSETERSGRESEGREARSEGMIVKENERKQQEGRKRNNASGTCKFSGPSLQEKKKGEGGGGVTHLQDDLLNLSRSDGEKKTDREQRGTEQILLTDLLKAVCFAVKLDEKKEVLGTKKKSVLIDYTTT